MKKIIKLIVVLSILTIVFATFGETIYSIRINGLDDKEDLQKAIEYVEYNGWEYNVEKGKESYIRLDLVNKESMAGILSLLNEEKYSYLLEGIVVKEEEKEYKDDQKMSVVDIEDAKKKESYPVGGFFKNYMFLSDITIKGNVGNYSHFFVIDENWQPVNSPYIYLDITYSEVFEELNSNVNVLVNGFPIVSLKLENKTNRITEKIDIPIKYLKEGFNKIDFVTYHRISGNICDDNINPGNWITIKDNTYVNVEFLENRDVLNLSNYPYPYLNDKYDKGLEDYVLLISKDARDSVLSAYGILSAGFGRYYEFSNIESNVKIFDDLDLDTIDDKNIIYIGSFKEVSKHFPNVLKYSDSFFDDKGMIVEIESPYNRDKNLLIIVSNDDKLIESATMMLNSKDYVNQMIDSVQIVQDSDKVIFENKIIEEKLRFDEFGYEDVLLKGVRRSSAGYLIDIPKNWELLRGSKFVLIDRNSDLLNFDKSSITLSINGQPIGSRRITSKDGIENIYEFDIPKNFLLLNQFNLVIEYNLDSGDLDCNDTGVDDTLWAIISSESYFDFKIREKDFHSLRDYTTPFIKNFKFNDLTFVIPDELNEEYIRLVFDISGYLGKKVNDFNGYKLVRESNFSSLDYDANLIVLGTPDDNKIIKDINKNLYLKYNESFTDYVDNDKIVLLNNYNTEMASIQIVKSIYNSRKDILVVSSLRASNIDLTNEYLSDVAKVSLLNGEVMIVGTNNYSKSFDFNKDDSSLNEAPDISKIGSNENDLFILIVTLSMMIIVLIILIVVYSRRRRRE